MLKMLACLLKRLLCHLLSLQLVNIVHHFVEQDKKVLILGRKHMLNWPKKSMQYLYNNAAVFLTDNL